MFFMNVEYNSGRNVFFPSSSHTEVPVGGATGREEENQDLRPAETSCPLLITQHLLFLLLQNKKMGGGALEERFHI